MSSHIPVAAWELCNEPYLFQGPNEFFTNEADYAAKMKPCRDEIKTADSNAVVAVFFSDPSRTATFWDDSPSGSGAQWRDAVVYHYYPILPTNAPFPDLMAMDNAVLFSNSTMYVTNILMAKTTNENATFLLTEFAPAKGNGDGTQNPPTSTLYSGIYAAEMVMRLSTCPRVTFAGGFQLVNGSGVATTNDFASAAAKAASKGDTTNTVGLPFGYFLSAQVSAEAVAYWAINRSTAVYATTVLANGPTAPMDTNSLTSMPALCGQAYQGGNGKCYVLLTNRDPNAIPVEIRQDGAAMTNQFLETFVTGGDPSVVNSNPPATNNAAIQTTNTANPATIPPYSVVRLEWTVLPAQIPILTVEALDANQILQWTGLTNLIYNALGAATPLGPWATLRSVTASQTNLAFTNWNNGPEQFYRLLIP